MKQQLYINIDGEPLELNSSSVLQIEETNPYLQFTDDLQGDFSYPVDVPLSAANRRILKHTQLLPVINKNLTIQNVTVGDSTEQLYGVLRKEQISGNFNYVGTDKLSVYFLKGWSSFLKDVQDKTLQSAEYGGKRSFPYVPGQLLKDSAMYAHFTNIAYYGSIDTTDYTLFPVYNSDPPYPGKTDDSAYTLNPTFVNLNDSGDDSYYTGQSAIFLFPYLNYVLKRVFASFGWTVEGFIFDDPDYKKMVLLNTYRVDPFVIEGGNYVFDLKESMPLVSISSFLVGLKNRMGWWYDWDYAKKKCTIRQVQQVFVTRRGIDITNKIESAFNLKIAEKNKIYALGSNGIDTTLWDYKGVKKTSAELPAPAQGLAGNVWFVAYENYFYICELKDGSDVVYEWQLFQENDFGYLPKDNTDTISTICNITGTKIIDLNDALYLEHGKILVPAADMQMDNGDKEAFTICYHFGRQASKPNVGILHHYPYGGSYPYGWQGGKMANFSLSYQFIDPFTGEDIGLYKVFWKFFLDKLVATETLEVTAALTRQQVYSFTWETSYLINNTQYIVTKRQRNIPYDDGLALTLIRV